MVTSSVLVDEPLVDPLIEFWLDPTEEGKRRIVRGFRFDGEIMPVVDATINLTAREDASASFTVAVSDFRVNPETRYDPETPRKKWDYPVIEIFLDYDEDALNPATLNEYSVLFNGKRITVQDFSFRAELKGALRGVGMVTLRVASNRITFNPPGRPE